MIMKEKYFLNANNDNKDYFLWDDVEDETKEKLKNKNDK